MKNILIWGSGHFQLLEGFESGVCAKRIIESKKLSKDFVHGVQVDLLCGCQL